MINEYKKEIEQIVLEIEILNNRKNELTRLLTIINIQKGKFYIFKNTGSFIVFCTDLSTNKKLYPNQFCGCIIQSTDSHYKIGHFSEIWDSEQFIEYTKTIIINE